MDYTTGEDGINIFSKTVQVEPRQKYQYKFRVGEGDWWILDETAATGQSQFPFLLSTATTLTRYSDG